MYFSLRWRTSGHFSRREAFEHFSRHRGNDIVPAHCKLVERLPAVRHSGKCADGRGAECRRGLEVTGQSAELLQRFGLLGVAKAPYGVEFVYGGHCGGCQSALPNEKAAAAKLGKVLVSLEDGGALDEGAPALKVRFRPSESIRRKQVRSDRRLGSIAAFPLRNNPEVATHD